MTFPTRGISQSENEPRGRSLERAAISGAPAAAAVVWQDGGENCTPLMNAVAAMRDLAALLAERGGDVVAALGYLHVAGAGMAALDGAVTAGEELRAAFDRFEKLLDNQAVEPPNAIAPALNLMRAVCTFSDLLASGVAHALQDAHDIDEAAELLRQGRADVLGEGYYRRVERR